VAIQQAAWLARLSTAVYIWRRHAFGGDDWRDGPHDLAAWRHGSLTHFRLKRGWHPLQEHLCCLYQAAVSQQRPSRLALSTLETILDKWAGGPSISMAVDS